MTQLSVPISVPPADATALDATPSDATAAAPTAATNNAAAGGAAAGGRDSDVATPAEAAAHFAARLRFETDVSDVHAALHAGRPGLVVVDSRSVEAWEQGHLPGALHLPTAEIAARAAALVPAGTLVVTYCWGPGCNGATRAALEFARLGYQVKEMLGGYEYWVREGLPVQTLTGLTTRAADPLTAPASGAHCAC